MAFVFTIDTTQAGATNNSGFLLPLVFGGDYDFFVDWGDAGCEDNITVYNQAEVTHQYADTGIYQISITGVGLTGWQFAFIGDDDKLLNISEWGSDVLTIYNDEAFAGCSNLTCNATGGPNLSGSMVGMFDGCSAMISGVKDFDMSLVTNTESMFEGAFDFNDDLSNWDLSNTTNVSRMFWDALDFNNNGQTGIGNWNVSKSTTFASMFRNADSFNQPIHTWTMPTSNSFSMATMFRDNGGFNNGGVSMTTWLEGVTGLTSMQEMFYNATSFNQIISGWDVSNVTNMNGTFRNADSFNQNIQPWDTSKVTDATNMFLDNGGFNNGGVSMSNMDWSSCSTFLQMFRQTDSFNQAVDNWDVSSAVSLVGMFERNDGFNQDISSWIMPVTSCSAERMFFLASVFNNGGNSMSSFNTSGINNIQQMFQQSAFNQPVNGWDVSNVTDMEATFRICPFDQTLSGWDVSNVTNFTNFLTSSELSCENYDSTLQYWATLDLTNSLTFGGGNSTFTPLGSGSRQSIIDNDLWSFNDGGVVEIGPLGINFTVDIDESGFYTVNTSAPIIVSAIGTGECTDTTTLSSTYQWYKTTGTDVTAGVAIAGATAATYNYTPTFDDDGSGLYAVSISTNDYGTATGTGTVQLLFITNTLTPTGDISNGGGYAPTPIYEKVEADNGQTTTSPLTPANDDFEIGLADPSSFDATTSAIVRSRFRKVDSGGNPAADGDTIDVTIELVETGNVLQTFNFNDIGTGNELNESVVSNAAKNNINNPNDLSIRLSANASTTVVGKERAAQVARLDFAGGIVLSTPAGGNWPFSGMPVMTGLDGTTIAYNNNIIVNYQGKRGIPGNNFGVITGPANPNATTYFSGVLANRFRGGYRG